MNWVRKLIESAKEAEAQAAARRRGETLDWLEPVEEPTQAPLPSDEQAESEEPAEPPLESLSLPEQPVAAVESPEIPANEPIADFHEIGEIPEMSEIADFAEIDSPEQAGIEQASDPSSPDAGPAFEPGDLDAPEQIVSELGDFDLPPGESVVDFGEDSAPEQSVFEAGDIPAVSDESSSVDSDTWPEIANFEVYDAGEIEATDTVSEDSSPPEPVDELPESQEVPTVDEPEVTQSSVYEPDAASVEDQNPYTFSVPAEPENSGFVGFQGIEDLPDVSERQLELEELVDPSKPQAEREQAQVDLHQKMSEDLASSLAQELDGKFDEMRLHQEHTVHEYFNRQMLITQFFKGT